MAVLHVCPLCQKEAFSLDWNGRNWDGEITVAALAKDMTRERYKKACLFVFMVITSDILPLYPSTKPLPRSLSSSESSTSISVH